MEISPFPHHGPLEPDQHGEQNELVDDLVRRVSERRVTALLGPRRHGKTTALRAVVRSTVRVGDRRAGSTSTRSLRGPTSPVASIESLAEIGAVGSPNVTELAARLNLPLGMLADRAAQACAATTRPVAHRPVATRHPRQGVAQPAGRARDRRVLRHRRCRRSRRPAADRRSSITSRRSGCCSPDRSRRRCRCSSPTEPNRSTPRPTSSKRAAVRSRRGRTHRPSRVRVDRPISRVDRVRRSLRSPEVIRIG